MTITERLAIYTVTALPKIDPGKHEAETAHRDRLEANPALKATVSASVRDRSG